jgi:hypothetical protein
MTNVEGMTKPETGIKECGLAFGHASSAIKTVFAESKTRL